MLFAGHPTLGSCASWLRTGGKPATPGIVRQECGVGIVCVDTTGPVPAFAAPKTTVAPMPDEKLQAIADALGLAPDRIVRTAVLANGPVWHVLELASAVDVLAADSAKIRYPQFLGVGLIGAHPKGSECAFEVRNLAPSSGMSEDPITGSLNAAIACWMYGLGHWRGPVTVAQGTRINRVGRVFIRRDNATDTVWVGGETRFLIEGTLTL
jgi:PhzF family phenazine biosynthesis protein